MKNSIFIFISLLSIISCRYTDKNSESSIPVVDLNKKYPEKKIKLKDIADVTYIPFETRDNVLLSGTTNMILSKDTIAVCDMIQGTVFFFNREGKYLNSFNRKGGAGDEYLIMSNATVDFNRQEVYIIDHMYKMRVYNFNGELKRAMILDKEIRPESFLNYNKDYIACYVDFINYGNKIKIESGQYKEWPKDNHPYLLINKATGTVTSIPIKVEEPISSKHWDLKSPQSSFDLYIRPLIKGSENELIISEYALDTVYSFHNDKLTPLIVRNLKQESKKTPYLSSVCIKSDRYLFFHIIKKDIKTNNYEYLTYDRKTGEIFIPIVEFPEGLERYLDFNYNIDLPANYTYTSVSAERLIKWNEESKITGKIKKIASTLKPEDNEVLILIKFKE